MARGFSFSRAPSGIPLVQHYPTKAAQTFLEGEVLVLDANGELTVAVAGATSVIGIAGAGAFRGRGYELANASQILQVTGRDSYCPVYLADANTIFVGRGVNGGTDPVTPTDTMVDVSFDIGVSAGVWYVNIASSATPAVEIVDIDKFEKLFYFKFLASVYQLP